MVRYSLRRLAHAVLVLWATLTATFLLLYALPGDAALRRAGASSEGAVLDPERLAQIRAEMGLDDPLVVQYLRALWGAVRGDFGRSLQTGRDALEMYLEGVPQTLQLAAAAFVLGLTAGFVWALLASLVRVRFLRQWLLSLPALGVSLPTFWIGLVALQYVSFRWTLLPGFGNDGWQSVVLPAAVLAVPTSAVTAQVLSRGLESALASPFVQTARAKGASWRRIVLGHALRNAVLPVITTLGMTAGHLIAGSVVVETVFSRSGVGSVAVAAVGFQDTPVVLVAVVFAAVAYVAVNLIVDLIYPLVDSRIRLRSAQRGGPVPQGAPA